MMRSDYSKHYSPCCDESMHRPAYKGKVTEQDYETIATWFCMSCGNTFTVRNGVVVPA